MESSTITMTIPDVILNSGHKMPFIGLGTSADAPRPPTEELAAILVDAIEMGYRHFDTARAYSTEEAVGMAVKEAVKRGLIKNRDEVFITTKLWCTDAHPDLVIPALRNSLQSLKMEYVDLFLIHWPVRLKQDVALVFDLPKEAILPFDMKGTWEAMEECCRLGLAKSVGVSNCSSKKISLLLQNANIPPAVNQVEMNTGWQQQELLEYCKVKGIHLCAWSPLGAYGKRWGSNSVMECTLLKEIANAKGNKTLAQVALRWIYEQGAGIVVKSFNTERMKQNLEIFDFKLSEEEQEKIQQLPQKKGYAGDMFIYEHGPYKSYEELWDSPVVGCEFITN